MAAMAGWGKKAETGGIWKPGSQEGGGFLFGRSGVERGKGAGVSAMFCTNLLCWAFLKAVVFDLVERAIEQVGRMNGKAVGECHRRDVECEGESGG